MSSQAEAEAGVYARESGFLERWVQIGVASGRVLSVSFPESVDDEVLPDLELLDRVEAYLEGSDDDFDDVDVAMTMPTDQRDVLESVRTVPYGEQASVEELVGMTAGLDPEDDDDLQLARTALAENPAPLVVPDHRVRDGPSAAPPEVEQRLRSLEGLKQLPGRRPRHPGAAPPTPTVDRTHSWPSSAANNRS